MAASCQGTGCARPVVAAASVLVVTPDLPVKDVAELIAHAPAHPGKLNYGLSGGGMVHVPYRGVAPAVTALVQGGSQLMVGLVPNNLPWVRSGRLRAPAVGLPEPTPLLPGVPTLRSYGSTNFDVPSWFVLVASDQIPAPGAEKLRAAVSDAVAAPAFAKWLEAVSARPLSISGPALRDFLAEQSRRREPIIQSAKVRLD